MIIIKNYEKQACTCSTYTSVSYIPKNQRWQNQQVKLPPYCHLMYYYLYNEPQNMPYKITNRSWEESEQPMTASLLTL